MDQIAKPRRRGGLRRRLLRMYWAIERRLVPGLRYSQAAYEEALQQHVAAGTRWLDVGCGHKLLPNWRSAQEGDLVRLSGRVVGLDPDLGALRQHASIELRVGGHLDHLPFAPSSFDLVTANMVLEHLGTPGAQLKEIFRVLAPGGALLFHTPNLRGYTTLLARAAPDRLKQRLALMLEARNAEDVYPTFYLANSSRQLETLAEECGFESPEIQWINTSAMFAVVPPLAAIELLWIRLLTRERFQGLRPNLLGVFRKPPAGP